MNWYHSFDSIAAYMADKKAKEEMIKSAKRPAMVWNGKPLKYRFLLYCSNECFPNVTAYNLNEGWFQSGELLITENFLVHRIS